MFLLDRPSPALIAHVLEEEREYALSYAPVGVTRGGIHTRLRRTYHHAQLGFGEDTFVRAVAAMNTWQMYRTGWTDVSPANVVAEPEQVFATVVHHLGFWSVNPCRVVYREHSEGDERVEAFAIGTLPGHAERGEERFSVHWNRLDNTVAFEILAFAEPRHWLAVLGTPIVWNLQRRFAHHALAAMHAATR